MKRVKQFITRACRWDYAFLCLLLVVNLVIHFSIIENPPTHIFDEVHYVSDANRILEGQTELRGEHPPLGKLIIGSGIALFGDNPIGWRFFPVLFGTANILLFFLIFRRLTMSLRVSNISIFLLTFENLSFVQGSIAMLDVFSLTFILMSFWLYLRGNYLMSTLSVVFATLIKLTGVFAIGIIFLHWLIANRKDRGRFVVSLAMMPIIFLLVMIAIDALIFHQFTNPFLDLSNMMSKSMSLTFAEAVHPSQMPPWELLIIPNVTPYNYEPYYYGTVSFTLWVLIIPTVIYMAVKAMKKNAAGLFGSLWFAGNFLVWIPIVLITDRITFIYYLYPVIGVICLGLGIGLSRLVDIWQGSQTGKFRKVALFGVTIFLLLHLATFFFLSPMNPWPVKHLLLGLMN